MIEFHILRYTIRIIHNSTPRKSLESPRTNRNMQLYRTLGYQKAKFTQFRSRKISNGHKFLLVQLTKMSLKTFKFWSEVQAYFLFQNQIKFTKIIRLKLFFLFWHFRNLSWNISKTTRNKKCLQQILYLWSRSINFDFESFSGNALLANSTTKWSQNEDSLLRKNIALKELQLFLAVHFSRKVFVGKVLAIKVEGRCKGYKND